MRVNNLLPGPIRGERIRGVFASMDQLKGAQPRATAQNSVEVMTLQRGYDGGEPKQDCPVPTDIAHICYFLGSDETLAFNGHNFKVTHGRKVLQESRSNWARCHVAAADAFGTP